MTDTPAPLLKATNLTKTYLVGRSPFKARRKKVHAVNGVTLSVWPGETLGIVGESGCGKSSLGRCLMRLQSISGGKLEIKGQDITHLDQRRLRPLRREMQMVFQDPAASLNARRRVGDLLAEPFRIHSDMAETAIADRVRGLLARVGLHPEHADRFPHEFSGGQKQRIGIARALALNPELVILDEPVSALDVSIQAQIVNLLADLRDELSLTYVFIAHDLAVVRQISTRVAVMYLGEIVEIGNAEQLFAAPRHPYTAALRAAVPRIGGGKKPDKGLVESERPSPQNPPPGCKFHTRCPFARDKCRTDRPVLRGADREAVACHYPLDAPTGIAAALM
ncbi:ABC-transporter ATP-binding protein [Marinibacterium anthonyi]|nr:ABC-transporter ATP-binding protein [Marinibacterium anthonyi]